jgi:hypothetical protein
MLGEFLSANVSTPFLIFMVKSRENSLHCALANNISIIGFGGLKDEAEVTYWSGILGTYSYTVPFRKTSHF